MCCPALHAPLRLLPRQKSVDQSRRERVAASHAVKNLQILAILRLIKFPVAITNRSPVIQGRRFCFSQRRGHHLERVILHHLADHLLESFHLKRRSEEHTSELQSQSNLVCRLL